jgi:glutathione S-transferase
MALAHKGLETEFIPVGFTEKDTLAFSGQSLVPVLVDGETAITDSWHIACYLDEAYPDRPSLFGGDFGKATARVINAWAEQTLLFGLFPMVVLDLFNQTKESDRIYFRESREAAFGDTLESMQAGRDLILPIFQTGLDPLRSALEDRTMEPGDFREQAGLAVVKGDATPFLGGGVSIVC